jgi:hypothetical protein
VFARKMKRSQAGLCTLLHHAGLRHAGPDGETLYVDSTIWTTQSDPTSCKIGKSGSGIPFKTCDQGTISLQWASVCVDVLSM